MIKKNFPLLETKSPRSPFQKLLEEVPPDLEPPDPESPRGRIISSARVLFAEKGFDATSIRTIALNASVNLAMVNYYFSNKKALYQRVIITELIRTFRTIQSEFPPNLTSDQVVLRLPLVIANILRNNPVWAQLIRRELAEGAPNFKIVLETLGGFGPVELKTIMLNTLNQAQRDGSLKPLDPFCVIPTLITLGYGMVLMDPLLSIVSGMAISDDVVWKERLSAMEIILRDGLGNKGEMNSK